MLRLKSTIYTKTNIKKEHMKELRLLSALGIVLVFNRGVNYEKKRGWQVSFGPDETGERIITDLANMPEALWAYVGDTYHTFINVNRIKPLVIKSEDGYKLRADSLKEFMGSSQVRIDHSIIHFKYVDCLSNCCTEDLQYRLDEGWSILAIIPQVGQRRPDYIIGKEKEK